jgi:2-dehydropantoate 2-reductase
MRLTIIGAGAIGGTIGAHLIRAGHDVLLCDQDAAHVAAINASGLTIEGPVENFTVAATAVTPDALPDSIERAAVAVKSHHTNQAAELLRHRLAPDGYVVSFQNGLTASTLAAVVGWDRLIVSFVNFGADLMAPGRIMQGNIGTFRVGEPRGGGITPRVQELADILPYAVATDNIMGYLWSKEAYGAMLYAGAVSDLSIADSLEAPEWQPLMLAIAREVLAQASVKTEAFDGFDPDDLPGSLARLVTFNRTSAKSHSGIYRDLMVRRRKTEVDDLLRDLRGPLTTYAGELIQAIERGERTCEVANLELMAAYERAERLGRRLNAVVRVLSAPRRAPQGPLHGCPIAVKDMIDVAGNPRGNGNPEDMAGKARVADAPVVAALRNAGADVFATATLLEYAAGALHPEIPEALNPYDLTRTAGGSSGGPAALVGAGVCPLALGTDTGGSIRLPAHYCGTVGFKPSFGTIAEAGVEALSPSLDHVGLLGRDMRVTALAFAALTGTELAAIPDSIRVGVVSAQLEAGAMEAQVVVGLQAAVEKLRLAGAQLQEVDYTAFAELQQTFDDIFMWEAWQVHGERVRRNPSHYGPETLRLLQLASKATAASYQAAQSRREALVPKVHSAYGGIDVLLTPAAPFVAPLTTPAMDTPAGADEAMFTSVFNLSGDPAVVLQCGWGETGLPIGLQLSAPRQSDARLLAVGTWVESVLAVQPRPLAVS